MTCITSCSCGCHNTTGYTTDGCSLCSQYHPYYGGCIPIGDRSIPAVNTQTHIERFDYHPEIVRLLKSIDKKLDKLLRK